MSGVTGLVDTAVADKLAQRPDLVRLPSASVVPGLDPVFQVAAVANDVRLQSDAARARQMFAGTASPANQPAGTPMPAPADELSTAARAISAMLADLADLAGPARPVAGGAPLAPHGAATVPQALARSLAMALSASGLFYESHLAAFTAGLLPRAVLELEPQARLPMATATATATVRPDGAVPGPLAEAGASATAGIVHPQARGVVSQQLDLLASGVFQWRGEAWPGVPLQWRVEEDRSPPQEGDEAGAVPSWSTTLSLAMPDLGVVDVRLRLSGTTLAAVLEVGDGAASRLRERAGELQQQIEALGLDLSRVAIGMRGAP